MCAYKCRQDLRPDGKRTIEMGLRSRSIFGDQGLVFFVTTTIVHHDPIFGFGNQYYLILIESLKFVVSRYKAALFAYVFMPSHIHLVIAMPETRSISGLIRDFKKYTSTRIRQQLEKDGKSGTVKRLHMNAEGKKNQIFKLWMDRFDDLVIENDKTLQIKIEYIHNNPVKAGFVDQPEQWKYSSARNYILGDHSLMSVSIDWEIPSSEGVSGENS
jgi:REP element-mobilizing transposase RayT